MINPAANLVEGMALLQTQILARAGITAMATISIMDVEVGRQPDLTTLERCCQNYIPVFDPDNCEIICESCGCVNASETEYARELHSEDSKRQSTSEDHMITTSGLLVENGSSHAFRSWANKGLAMELGKPAFSQARDYLKKRVTTQTLQDPYTVGQMIDRNGFLYENNKGQTKYKVSYKQDKVYSDCMTHLYGLNQKHGRDDYERARAGKQVHSIFGVLIFGELPRLIAEIADFKANMEQAPDKAKAEAKESIYARAAHVRDTLVNLLGELELP